MGPRIHEHPRHFAAQVPAATVDPTTLTYLERVAGQIGQAAVDAWLTYVGWKDETEMPRAKRKPGPNRPSVRSLMHGPHEYYSARRQIPIEDRMQMAFDNARVR